MPRRWAIFLITSCNFFLSQFYRASTAVIAPQLLRDLHLDTAKLGLLSAAFFYAFALAQIPISIYLDRVGSKLMICTLSAVGILGALLFATAHSLGMGIAGRALLGIGMSCNLMGTLKLLSLWFRPSRFATLSGLVFSVGTAGNMAATTPLVAMVQWIGWRQAFAVIALINLLIVLVLFTVVRDRPPDSELADNIEDDTQNTHQTLNNLRRLLRRRDYWIISLSTFVSYGVFAAFQSLWAGPYLMDVLGLSPLPAGNMIFLMNLGLILGGPAWGVLSDRVFKTRKWMIFCGLLGLGLTTVSLSQIRADAGLMLIAGVFVAFGASRAAGLLMYPHIKELMPLRMAGAAMTGVNFFTMIGPAVFLQGLGTLMQTLYPGASRGPAAFQAALYVCLGCLLAVSLLYILTSDQKVNQ
jgi:sugar phosphate permease